MMTILDKVRRLERYIAIDSMGIDPVLEMTVDKLLSREIERMLELRMKLANQLAKFEESYAMKSTDFYARYENGEMGDKMDFVEWSATVEMMANVDKRLAILERKID